jgi:tetratricopeptide (TPR) repeat protein
MRNTTGSGDEQLERLLGDANRALSNEEYNLAIARCTTLLKSTADKRFALPAYYLRCQAYASIHQNQQAMSDAESAIRVSPSWPSGYVARAYLNASSGKYKLASTDLDAAIDRGPKNEFVLLNMAWFKAVCPEAAYRDGKKAVELARRACVITEWRDSACLDALATAYAECSDFDQAIKYETQAISTKIWRRASQKEKNRIAEEQRKHLGIFQSHKPFRDDFKYRD